MISTLMVAMGLKLFVVLDDPAAASRADVESAIERGIGFLLSSQNADGSWGGAGEAILTFTGDVWSNPETHRAWRVATTGLCCMALLEQRCDTKIQAAASRALDYLLANAVVKRPNEWDLMNSWAYIYGLQALATAYEHSCLAESPRLDEVRGVIGQLLEKLVDYQTIDGGWTYLELDTPKPLKPTGGTSFSTAAAVIAMQEALAKGFQIDEGMIRRAVEAIERCRLPNGAYTYGINIIPDPRHSEWIDQIKGSLGRIAVCQLALHMSGRKVETTQVQMGLDHFFTDHRFLDIARNRPIPHETYYYNSGYFYFFGHYYAARVIELLPPEKQALYWHRLQREIIKTQKADGSMRDYDMHRYHKPYGVAYGVMALNRSLIRTPPDLDSTLPSEAKVGEEG